MSERTSTELDLAGSSGILERLAWRVALKGAERIRIGRLTAVLPDGSRRDFGDRSADLHAEIHIHDVQALVRMLVHGETGGGEGYMDGLWSSPDLEALLRLAALNRSDARPVDRLVATPGPARTDDRPPSPAQHEGTRAAGTSAPTTTWATTSIGSSSTRR